MDQNAITDYYIVASSRFVNESIWQRVTSVALLHYSNSKGKASRPLPGAPNDQFEKTFSMNQARSIRPYKKNDDDPELDRDFLVRLWVVDKNMEKPRWKKRRHKVVEYAYHNSVSENKNSYDEVQRPVLKQPPLNQSPTGFLKPSSLEEAQLAPILARSNLLITRDIEWANLVLGFEQEPEFNSKTA